MKSILALVIIYSLCSYSQSLYINEVMSSNSRYMPDTSGEYYDWVEIYNSSDTSQNLEGYYLTDDITEPNKWKFPAVDIDTFLVVFASDKNSNELSVRHWEPIITWGDNWKYINANSSIPSSWRTASYSDSAWYEGPSGFGYGDNDDSTVVSQTNSALYIRKTFTIDDLENISEVLFHIDYDDAFVAYINGKEIARSNIGIAGTPPAYNAQASSGREAVIFTGGVPEKFAVAGWETILQEGENVIAVQIHNYGTGSSDLSAIPFLTMGLKNIPQNPHESHELLNLLPSMLHTNFKLSSEGELLILFSPEGEIVDTFFTGTLPANISKGRFPDGGNNFFLFNEPSPGGSNPESHYVNVAGTPQASHPGGFYSVPFYLSLMANDSSSAGIIYTTDGSEPGEGSIAYTGSILINKTKVIRARISNGTDLPGEIITHTYFINDDYSLPVISLSTDPGNFFDPDSGIYEMGPNASPENPHFGANFWQDWEKPVHIEFFEPGGEQGFSMDMGAKIYGAWSRAFAQKSLALFARSVYGDGSINYKIFPDLAIDKFESIVLRNSGNDWSYSMLRDAIMTKIASFGDVDIQAYRPAILFINGSYWGIHNIREKINEHFLAVHHNENPDSITILEGESTIVEGDNTEYTALLDYMRTHSLTNQNNYENVTKQVDIDEFIDYMLFQIYYDNTDWPGNNIKFWKSSSQGSKWRWILYDTDFGFGLYGFNYMNNTLEFATASNSSNYANLPWATFVLRALLTNSTFKNKFISRFADLSNSALLPDNINSIIDILAAGISGEIEEHKLRWGQSYLDWLDEIDRLKDFSNNRLSYVRTHFKNKFSLKGFSPIALSCDKMKGYIQVNTISVKNFPWAGTYFEGIPVTISAVPYPGYKFAGWNGTAQKTRVITVLPEDITGLTASFVPDTGRGNNIVINEINYNSAAGFDSEDWIELVNNSGSKVDLSGWTLMDENDSHTFIFPERTELLPGNYIVVCRDSALFTSMFPDCKNFKTGLSFGFGGNGDILRLFDNNFSLVDSVEYRNVSPWPSTPDGKGHTLSLIHPDLDNSMGENWNASIGIGTPGKINDVFVVDVNSAEQLPDVYALEQNFPNPFNPSTVIRYNLPEAGNVTLKIYDILGREVKTLVNEFTEAGRYSATFNSEELASGIYFYTLKAGNNFSKTKKMMLVR